MPRIDAGSDEVRRTADDARRHAQAAAWFTRLKSGTATQEDHEACAAWRRAAPDNERAYRNTVYWWEAAAQAPQASMRALQQQAELAVCAQGVARRRWLVGLGATAAAVAAGGVWLPMQSVSPLYETQLATVRGERRRVTLPEGSVLDLNTDTVASVRLFEDRREVVLSRGEVVFSVAHDASQPFVVQAGRARVRVTGTVFDVRVQEETTAVAVASGSVAVSGGSWWRRAEAALTAGQGIDVDDVGALSALRAVDMPVLTAWQRGRIVFENLPLAQVVQEMNRYLAQPLRLDDARLGTLRIAGVFSVDDPASILDALPAIAPVEVYRLPDGRASIVAR